VAQLRAARSRRATRPRRARELLDADAHQLAALGAYIRAWSQAYRNDGLVVIGVHTPEFSFEHDIARVHQATKDRAIDYPVAVDNDYEIWSAFANHYWPALYFVDADGFIGDHHFGEGRYERSERVIQRLLSVERQLVPVEGVGVEADADWDHLDTPETYLGYERTAHFASPAGAVFDDRRAHEVPERLRFNHWALAGEWKIGREHVVLDRARGSIAYRFHARDAHLVLSRGSREPIPFRVLLDGEAPGQSHGVDVDTDGQGVLQDGRPVPTRARAQRAAREDAEDHVPRAWRRGVRVHLRLARVTDPIKLCNWRRPPDGGHNPPAVARRGPYRPPRAVIPPQISVAQVEGFTLRQRAASSQDAETRQTSGACRPHKLRLLTLEPPDRLLRDARRSQSPSGHPPVRQTSAGAACQAPTASNA
jgi:hypothetical protein